MEDRDLLGLLVLNLDPRETKANLVHRVFPEKEALRVLWDLMDHKGFLVLKESRGQWVQLVHRGNKVLREIRDLWDGRVLKGHKGPRVKWDLKVIKGHKDQWDPRVIPMD